MTRGALTTFSIANDVAKYFAILPAAFVVDVPGNWPSLDVMGLSSHRPTPILAAVAFNALVIVALVPLALQGRGATAPVGAAATAPHATCSMYGLGGLGGAVRRHQGDRPAASSASIS